MKNKKTSEGEELTVAKAALPPQTPPCWPRGGTRSDPKSFYFNTLGVISGYCKIDPKKADEAEVTDFRIPPLTIQPLVENAIKHGLTKKSAKEFCKND